MARVEISPEAVEDLDRLIGSHGLPSDTRLRVARSLRALELFPRVGVELGGRWSGHRFVIGPWPWLIIVYELLEASDLVSVVAIHDGRSASSAAATDS
ncbi:MAG: type II toxin-antitoxin system RelE/ParE family toxin [Solirubrobacterales bacterium]